MTLQSYEDRKANAIDNTPLAIAKEEGEADEAARRRPMTAASNSTSDIHEGAKSLGKLVFNGAREVGMSEAQIEAMKQRMAQWVNAVVAHARDTRAVHSLDMEEKDRRALLRDMEQSRRELFREIFG